MNKYSDAREMYKAIKDDYGVLNAVAAGRSAASWLNVALLASQDNVPVPLIPNNLPVELKLGIDEQFREARVRWPHGIFWIIDDDKVSIDRARMYRVADAMGFRISAGLLVRVVSNPHCLAAGRRFIVSQRLVDLNLALKKYAQNGVLDISEDTDTAILNEIDSFIEKHYKHVVMQFTDVSRMD